MKILIVTDYLGRIFSKWSAVPYRSGYDWSLLMKELGKRDVVADTCMYSELNSKALDCYERIFLTSQEDEGLVYKSYIEDWARWLTKQGHQIYPTYEYLCAHHNKVAMKLLYSEQKFWCFSTEQELLRIGNELTEYPYVLKLASGASSTGVTKVDCFRDIVECVRKNQTFSFRYAMRDWVRSLRHRGYIRESLSRSKFIIEPFIPNLNSDFKILVFGNKFFVLERFPKKGDFRASGSGLLEYNENVPDAVLRKALELKIRFDVPFMAMDIGFSEGQAYLIEYQFVNFGTHTVDTAPFYFIAEGEGFKRIRCSNVRVEALFAEAIY